MWIISLGSRNEDEQVVADGGESKPEPLEPTPESFRMPRPRNWGNGHQCLLFFVAFYAVGFMVLDLNSLPQTWE